MKCQSAGVRNCFALTLLVAFSCPLSEAANQNNEGANRQILTAAREKYYNLRRVGLIEFQANIKPNWQVVADFQSNTDALKVLEAIHFSISVDSDSKLRLEHQNELIPTSPKTSEYIEKIFADMDGAVSRFISTWSVFMLTSPFSPGDHNYEIKEFADRYQFSRDEGANNVVTVTDKQFKINEIKVTGATFKASLKPVLKQTPAGFILNGYAANYETGARNTRVEVRLEYQLISGLQMPRKVNVNTVFEGKPAEIEWMFSDYQIKVR